MRRRDVDGADERTRKLRALRTERIAAGLCAFCGARPRRPDMASCESCGGRGGESRRPRAAKPTSASRWKKTKPRECARCSYPPVRGSIHCAEHLATLAQVATERERGLWPGLER